MSKFSNMMIVLVCIQLAMMFFTGVDYNNELASIEYYNNTLNASTDVVSFGLLGNYNISNGGTFLQTVMHPENIGSLNFFLTFIGISTVMGLVGLVAGSQFGFKTDFLVFAPVVFSFALTAQIFINLWSFMYSNLSAMIGASCVASYTCDNFIRGVLGFCIGLPALYYVLVIIEWWRNSSS